MIAGHESAGYVEEVGPGVTSVKPGDPVVVSLLVSCGKCLYCRTGRTHMCSAAWPLDKESRIHTKQGKSLAQAMKTGSFGNIPWLTNLRWSKPPRICRWTGRRF